jgi:Ca-activated chloride channel homolog
MIFASPLAFLLLIALCLLFLIPLSRGRRKGGFSFSSGYPLNVGIVTLRQRIIWVPKALMVIGLVLGIIAMARPRKPLYETKKTTEGVAIELVIDRSGSMNAEIEQGRGFVRRIDVAKKAVLDFTLGDGRALAGRPDDLVGLVSFARYADTLSPLTLSHDIIEQFIDSLDTVTTESEDGTSIGDAIALAAARLKAVDNAVDPDKGYVIKSKVIVLLTDGANNAGTYSPAEAAELASEWKIKIYTIGFGGEASYVVDGFFGARRVTAGSAVDSAALAELAGATGGAYFQADTPDELLDVYRTIDALEKSEVVSSTSVEYRELFVWFAMGALFFLSAGRMLSSTVLRRLP